MLRPRRRITPLEVLESRLVLAVISVASVQVVEAGIATQAIFRANLNQASTEAISLSYSTANGTARAGKDYLATEARVTIAAGQTSTTFSVPILASDVAGKPSEQFVVNLKASPGNSVASRKVEATIVDGIAAPTISVSDLSLTEPGSGRSKQGAVVVSVANPSAKPVRISYATADGTATSVGKSREFQAQAGVVTIRPGATSVKIPVRIFGNAGVDETFDVTLKSATNATLSTIQPGGDFSRVVIQKSPQASARPTISVSNPVVPAGEPATFTVSLSSASSVPVSFRYSTETVTASSSAFSKVDDVLMIPAGQTTATITVPTTTNPSQPVLQTFLLNLSSPANAVLATPNALATITEVTTGPIGVPVPSAVVSAGSATVGTSGTTTLPFTITLSSASTSTVTVDYSTINDFASAGIDFTGTSGTLTFAPGVTTQIVAVTVNGETPNATQKNFSLVISNAKNSVITTSSAVGVIHYTSPLPTVLVSSASTTVGTSGQTVMAFTVSLSAPSAQDVLVNFATADGTAIAGTDYISLGGDFIFVPGFTTQTIFVDVKGEVTSAASKTFTLNVLNATNATNATASGTGTIRYIPLITPGTVA